MVPFGFMLGLFLAVWLIKVCHGRCQRMLLTVAILVLTLSIVATQSRGAVLALCLSLPILLWEYKKMLVGLMAGIILLISQSPMQRRVQVDTFFEDTARMSLIFYSLEVLKEYPVVGTGFSIDAFRDTDFIDKELYHSRLPAEYQKYPPSWFHRPHNMFLSMAIRTGVVGMVLYAGVFLVSILVCCRLLLYGKDLFIRTHSRCCLALLIMFLSNGMLQVMTTHFIDMILFIILSCMTIIWKIDSKLNLAACNHRSER